VLRAVAGGVATDVAPSQWFLIVTSSAAVFIVAGKRHAELVELGERSADSRAVLDHYTVAFLRFVWTTAAVTTVIAYCLWAFDVRDLPRTNAAFQLSIVPFSLAIARYALLIEKGVGSTPEDVVIRDRHLHVYGFAWAVLYGFGVLVR
jgi:decaprenyl-phosphate phosphoribosyltransferase